MRRIICIIIALFIVGVGSSSAKKLRIMSYNVRNCIDMSKGNSTEGCAATIKSIAPDVVAIQELDSMTKRRECYLLGELAKRTGYYDYYGPTIKYKGGKYGVGILSKEKALSIQFHNLPCSSEPRGLLIAEFEKYYVASTHISLHEKDRLLSAVLIREILSKLNKPVFFAGDLNDTPESKFIGELKNFMTPLTDPKKFTFPSTGPDRCIDYIMGYGATFNLLDYKVIYSNLDSDHLPIYVDVKMKK